MKTLFLAIVAFVVLGNISCIKVNENKPAKDKDYEAYLDSVWAADPNYFLDVVVETDEYQDYVADHEEWWKN